MPQQEIKTLSKIAGAMGIINIAGMMISFVVVMFITRIVGASVFGTVAVSLSAIGVLKVFSTLGLDKGALRFISYYRGKNDLSGMRKTIWLTTGTVSIISLLIVLISSAGFNTQIALLFPEIPEINDVFQIFIYLLPIIALSEIVNNLLTGLEKPQYVLVAQKILLPISRFLFLLILVYFYTKLDAFLYATFISQAFISVLLLMLFVKVFCKIELPSCTSESPFSLKQFVLFSLPLTLIPVFNLSTQHVDTLIVGHFMGANDAGIYAIVRRIGEVILMPLSMVAGIFSAQASRMFAQKRNQEIKSLYLFSTKWIYILSAIIFLVVSLEAELILKLFGEEFVSGSKALQLFVFGQLINASFGPSGVLLLMLNRSKLVLLNSLISAIVGVLSAYFLVKDYGLLGATAAVTITIIVVNILAMLQLYFIFGILPCSSAVFIKRLGIILGSVYLTSLLLVNIKVDSAFYHIGITVMVAFILFPFLLYVFEGFSENDRMILRLTGMKFKRLVTR